MQKSYNGIHKIYLELETTGSIKECLNTFVLDDDIKEDLNKGPNVDPYDENGTADVVARATGTDAGANCGERIIGARTYGLPDHRALELKDHKEQVETTDDYDLGGVDVEFPDITKYPESEPIVCFIRDDSEKVFICSSANRYLGLNFQICKVISGLYSDTCMKIDTSNVVQREIIYKRTGNTDLEHFYNEDDIH